MKLGKNWIKKLGKNWFYLTIPVFRNVTGFYLVFVHLTELVRVKYGWVE